MLIPGKDKWHGSKVSYLVPDLPSAEEVFAFWKAIDANRWYTNFGPLEQQFRQALARECFGTATADRVALAATGTAALYLALLAHRLPPCGKVIMPAFTFPATAIAAIKAGLTPVFLDVETTLNLNPERLADALRSTDACAAIPLCWHSHADSLAVWDEVAQATGKCVVVDAAPALERHPLPRHCTYVFSLHATKPFGIGEGGVVVSHDEAVIRSVRKLSNFDFENGRIEAIGDNAKLSEYHAAVGLAQLARYQTITARRAAIAGYYRDRLSKMPETIQLIFDLDRKPAYLLARTLHGNAGALGDFLHAHGVGSRQVYCPPLNQQPAFRHIKSIGTLVNTDSAANSVIALPFHNHLSTKDVDLVVQLLQQFSRQAQWSYIRAGNGV